MTYDQIIADLNVIIKKVLDNDAIKIDGNSVATDYEEWDSLNNILLVIEIEKHFKIKINSADIKHWENVGKMAQTIETRIKK